MGEHEFEQKALTKAIDTVLQEQSNGAQELRLATPGGRFQVRWDEGGSATALGQLPFFAEFLEVSGFFAGNWWSWYVRLAHPQARRGAITSRPMLLSGVARLTEHAGQSRLLLTLMHGAGDQIKAMIANIRQGLEQVRATAPQLPKLGRWIALVRYIVEKIIAAKPKHPPPLGFHPPWLVYETG